jgi:hypothetical protein
MTTMSASALIVMAAIMVAAMATWLSLVFLAARVPGRHGTPAGTSPGSQAGAASGGKTALVPPPRPPSHGDDRVAHDEVTVGLR